MKTLKNEYYVILQQRCTDEYGWEDVDSFKTNSTFVLSREDREDLLNSKKEYKIAQPTLPLRTIHRKTPIVQS